MKRRKRIYLITSFLFALLLLYPYIVKDFVNIEHDTFFHLSRIQGMAEALSRGDILPAVYPDKNLGYGYGSPMFYCDILLIPSALLYLLGVPLSICYAQLVFVLSFISILGMMFVYDHALKSKNKNCISSILAGAAYGFANYRITNIYVRGALGEVTALAFLPWLILALYELIYEGRKESWWKLTLTLSLLAVSHNLSFLMSVILCIILTLCWHKKLTEDVFKACVKAVLFAFGLTMFFTIPMLEQTSSQDFYLKHWGSDLAGYAMKLRQYFANKTVFGYGGNSQPTGKSNVIEVRGGS